MLLLLLLLSLLLLLLLLLTVIINCSYIHSSSQGLYQGVCENTWLLKTQSNENSASQVPNKGAKVLPILLNFPMPPPLPPSRVTSLEQTTDVQTIDE